MLSHEKIIEALVATLQDEVLPSVGPGSARVQLYSVIDVMENLPACVQWGGQLEEIEIAACRRAAAELSGLLDGDLAGRCRDFAEATHGGQAELERGRSLLVDVIEGDAFDSPRVRATVDACLGQTVLSAAMFIKPSRLVEVSKG